MSAAYHRRGPCSGSRGYLIVLFVVIVAFVGIAAAMQVLILTSVGTTSRAYDSYRQGATEMARLERVVGEALLDVCQISVARSVQPLAQTLDARLSQLCTGGASVIVATAPASLPAITTFPSSAAVTDPLVEIPADMRALLSAQTAWVAGPRLATYPEIDFEFTSTRSVLDVARTYKTQVKARLFAAPLTRFPIAAYELPAEIGTPLAIGHPAPPSALPAGLVPSRDPAFITDLQAHADVLPYHYRQRATLAAAYQYLFSQAFVDRVAEYAGITHYHNLDAGGATASLNGMTAAGAVTNWDLGVAGSGTYGTITMSKDAAVVFTEQGGQTLRLYDSAGNASAPALLILALGPSDTNNGSLTLELATIARPVVVIGYNVRVTASAGAAVNGALFLDPFSSMEPTSPITIGHLSYWAGSATIPENAVAAGPLSAPAEAIAPRVVFVTTRGTRI